MTKEQKAKLMELAIASLQEKYLEQTSTPSRKRRFADPNAQMDHEFFEDMKAIADYTGTPWGGKYDTI